MNKTQLIDSVAETLELSKATAKQTVEFIWDKITDTLSVGEEVFIAGFGRFKVNLRAERKGRDPRSGKEITIPERRVTSFKAAKALSDAVQENSDENTDA